jgi:radical SAM protein with 4Fe4S-binding SPASM domain
VVLTKACNLACTFCKDYETEGAKNVTAENLARVASQLFPTARRLSICSGGEPYLHRELEFILRLAREYKLYTWVLSNGMLLKEDRMRAIVRDGLITEHGFSVDGIEPPTVEAIRVFAKLPVILDNIRMLQRIIREEGKSKPGLTIRYALMRSNVEELPAAVEYWGREGIGKIDAGYLSLANELPRDQSLFFHQELTERVFQEARNVAARYPSLQLNLPNLVRDELVKKTNPAPCTRPWDFVMIDPSGHVLPCYRAFEAVSMGVVYDEDRQLFKDIWNSDAYQALRRTVNRDGDKHFEYCKVCEFRYGWGDEGPHLGDTTWLETVSTGRPELVNIDHRRLKK